MKSIDMKLQSMKCSECGKIALKQSIIAHDAKVSYDGKTIDISIMQLPVIKCENCNDILFTNDTDECINQEIKNLRQKIKGS